MTDELTGDPQREIRRYLLKVVGIPVCVAMAVITVSALVFFVKFDGKVSGIQTTVQCQDHAFHQITHLAFTHDRNPRDYAKATSGC